MRTMRGEPSRETVLTALRAYWPDNQPLTQFLANAIAALPVRGSEMYVRDSELVRGMKNWKHIADKYG